MTLREMGIYKMKVGLFAHRFGEKSGVTGIGRMAGEECWIDQITEDGWAICPLFGGEEMQGLYVKFPVEIADSQVEEVLDKDGKHKIVQFKHEEATQ